MPLARALVKGGLPVLEITFRTAAALDALTAIAREVPDAVVGAGTVLDEAQLREFLGGQLAKFKIPARFVFSPEPLPRLGTGKFDRRALKAQYGS